MKSMPFAALIGILSCVSCLELGVHETEPEPAGTASSTSSSGSSGSILTGGAGGTGQGGAGQSGSTGGFAGSGASSGTGAGPVVAGCNPNDPTLVACFAFDGNFASTSLNLHKVGTTGVTFEPGVHGQAASFNGFAQMKISESTFWAVTEYTVEMQYYQRSYGAVRMGLMDSDNRYGVFVHGSGDLHCSRGVEYFVTKVGIPLNTWTHVACVYGAGVLRMYVDGVFGGEIPAPAISAGGPITIGSNAPSGDEFNGLIDDLHVWNVARSAADICKSSGKPGC